MKYACFVIMPFLPELNFFYLYIRNHLKKNYDIECERGDHRILTIPLLEKIRKLIIETDVIIADVTGRNPNVFYELGLADAYGKKIILITQDEIKEAPTDIRHMEFIKYDLSKDIDFISKLDNAFHNLLTDRYKKLYDLAEELLIKFNKSKNLKLEICSMKEFQTKIITIENPIEYHLPGIV
ncbi:MAG: hypothetical protein ABI840_12535, partial [bacterium]